MKSIHLIQDGLFDLASLVIHPYDGPIIGTLGSHTVDTGHPELPSYTTVLYFSRYKVFMAMQDF